MKKTAEERFWDKVLIGEGCWEWQAAKKSDGYGIFEAREFRSRLAHRISYELLVGEIPDGMFACHHCDNPSCVRPAHLFVGTAADNSRDMVAKGRNYQRARPERLSRGASHWFSQHPDLMPDNKGESNGQAKLTAESVREMRRLRLVGWSIVALSQRFSVSQASVSSICSGKRWKHVA